MAATSNRPGAKPVGVTKADVRHEGYQQWGAPEPSLERYHGYLADLYHQVDEMRRWKRKWYDGRDRYVLDNPDKLQGDEGDRKKQWSRTVDAQDAAGMEQWSHRQAMVYALAAQEERRRLESSGVVVV